jgi:hypothetical protein
MARARGCWIVNGMLDEGVPWDWVDLGVKRVMGIGIGMWSCRGEIMWN